MNLEEFHQLMNLFVYHDFPVRELPVIFNISMRLQVNELNSDRHYNMSFYEFLEAFCRVIDKASPIPEGEELENWSMHKRNEQSLFTKLENITHLIIQNITSPDYKIIKEKLALPIKEEDTGLYSWDSHLSYYSHLAPNFKAHSSMNFLFFFLHFFFIF